MNETTPFLFGLRNSNRAFGLPDNWGKNQFNNSFPAALACYMSQRQLEPVYLKLDKSLKVLHDKIKVSDVFGIDPLSPSAFYSFESILTPYETLIAGRLPRIDLVTNKLDGGVPKPLRGIEIKLTALPDNQTSILDEDNYGCEIVTRPDTIVYLALSIADAFKNDRVKLLRLMTPFAKKISNWRSTAAVLPHVKNACEILDEMLLMKLEEQKPLLMQPVWKTVGKKLILENNCLDIFVWSDFAFTRLFVDIAKTNNTRDSISRPTRTVVWLFKLLYDFARLGKIDYKNVIDALTYDTKNDKAFAVGGLVTKRYMKCQELKQPRIKKDEIKKIILGGGEKLLSPERRFDAAVLSTPNLF